MLSGENKNTISVVVPVYNVERYLRRCVDSLLAQDVAPLEIILVDDGSPDASGRICDEYATAHEHIRVIHKPNGGLSSARRAGWEQAYGDLIVFVDSDDYVAESYIRLLSEPFENEDVELCICGYATDKEGEITNARLPYDSEFIDRSRIAEDYILPVIGSIPDSEAINIPGFTWIRMYRTNLLQVSDFVSERDYFTEDVILNILYAKRMRGRIAVANLPLYYYCINPGSLTLKYRENAFKMLYACYCLCRKLTEDIGADSEALAKRLAANLTATVTYSVYNVGKIRNYSEYKSQLKQIFRNPDVVSLFNSGRWPKAATWHRIIGTVYRFRAYFALYQLLRLRKTL